MSGLHFTHCFIYGYNDHLGLSTKTKYFDTGPY